MEVKKLNWERILMSSIVAALIGAIAALLSNVWTDFKGWKKIERLIGNIHDTTLGRQHENIEKTIANEAKTIRTDSDKIHDLVGNITVTLNKQEVRYENLDTDQKEVRNNVIKLVSNWEELIRDNQELKQAIRELKLENDRLKDIVKEQNRNLDREKGRER